MPMHVFEFSSDAFPVWLIQQSNSRVFGWVFKGADCTRNADGKWTILAIFDDYVPKMLVDGEVRHILDPMPWIAVSRLALVLDTATEIKHPATDRTTGTT